MRYYGGVDEYTLEALGDAVQRRRKALGLSQQALGEAVGYREASAGVSISRLETGKLEPKADRLAAIADALGVSQATLEAEAASCTRHGSSVGSQIERILRASAQRDALKQAHRKLVAAHERASTHFLEPLRKVATEVQGVTLDSVGLPRVGDAPDDDLPAEVTYQIEFTRYGLERALAQGDERATFSQFTDSVAFGAAVAAGLDSALPSVTAQRALLAATGLAARSRTAPMGGMVGAVAVGFAVAALVERHKSQRVRRQKESAAKLAAAEQDLARTQPNVDALTAIVPRATDLLDYVAVHAAHALTRWRDQLGDGPLAWGAMTDEQHQRYQDFVEIAAAQLAVATIDLQTLAESPIDGLERATAVADQLLLQAQEVIASRV